jgi:hypothetical protein
MLPFLESGVSLAVTKGVDYLTKNRPAGKHKAKPTAQDQAIDAALCAVAIAPQVINVFGPSPVLARFVPLSLQAYYRLYKARPVLEAVSMAAIGAMALRQRGSRTADPRWLDNTMKLVGALRFGAQVISAPTAYTPHDEGHLVVTTRELNRLLKPNDCVLGLFLNGEARCYPLELLRKPHYVHDTVGGMAVAPTYCPLTNTALAFRDDWQGQRLDLNVVGSPNNNVAFYEGQSDGIIQQLEPHIAVGPNAGDPLQVYPLMLTSWRTWKALHPQTTGIWFEAGLKGGAVKSVLKLMERLDDRRPEPLLALRGGVDPRLPAKEEVLAVKVKGQSRVYTRDYLRRHPVINAELGGEPIVILYDPERDVATCFLRRFGDETLTFQEARHGKGIAEDQETGRLWLVTGMAADGEDCLSVLPFSVDKVRWFAWAHFNPEAKIAGEVAARAIARR